MIHLISGRLTLCFLFILVVFGCKRPIPPSNHDDREVRLKAIENDPEQRRRAIKQADLILTQLLEAGVNLPDVRGTPPEKIEARYDGSYYSYDSGNYSSDDYLWSIDRPRLKMTVRSRGGLEALINQEASELAFQRYEQISRGDQNSQAIIDHTDYATTASLRATSDAVLKALKPESSHDYKMSAYEARRERFDIKKQGRPFSYFYPSYSFYGFVYGLPCDGKWLRMTYDVFSGTLISMSHTDISASYPEPGAAQISIAKAKRIACRYIASTHLFPDIVVYCTGTKLTFERYGGPRVANDWKTDRPIITHVVRIKWRRRFSEGWFTNDVTVNAISGKIIDDAHYMMVGVGPRPKPVENCKDLF